MSERIETIIVTSGKNSAGTVFCCYKLYRITWLSKACTYQTGKI